MESFPCPRCQIGHCQPVQATYIQMYGDHLISIPNVEAWRCDICGLQEFTPETLMMVDHLLKKSSQESSRLNAKGITPTTGKLK
jgi:YgiT-type zinc finger domain-containing protein